MYTYGFANKPAVGWCMRTGAELGEENCSLTEVGKRGLSPRPDMEIAERRTMQRP